MSSNKSNKTQADSSASEDQSQQQSPQQDLNSSNNPPSVAAAPQQSLTFQLVSSLFRIFSFPLNLFLNNFFRVIKFTWSLLGIDSRRFVTDSLANVDTFIEDFEQKYGDQHPNFYRGSYAQALNEAKRELRFLLVYLHNDLHQDTDTFCQSVLTHKEVVTYINRNNLIFWACSVDLPEGYRASQAMRENSYPFLALVVLKNNHMTIVKKFEGQTSVERFLSQLQQSIVDNEASIVNSRLDRQQRDMNQQIRRQQDEDYLESLRADQEKERKKREEREQKEKVEQELRQRKLREQNEEERLKELRAQISKQLQPEPKAGNASVIKVRVKLPNGRQMTRLFSCQDSIKHLFEFVFSQPDCPKNFKLKTNFPVRELPCSHPTLQQPQCRSPEDPNEEPTSFEQFGITKDETLYLYDLDA